jgi:Na+-driven multidrug efflux pump
MCGGVIGASVYARRLRGRLDCVKVEQEMNTTLAKVLLLGVPLLLSLSWFAFWVVRILKTSKKLKRRTSNPEEMHAPDRPSS